MSVSTVGLSCVCSVSIVYLLVMMRRCSQAHKLFLTRSPPRSLALSLSLVRFLFSSHSRSLTRSLTHSPALPRSHARAHTHIHTHSLSIAPPYLKDTFYAFDLYKVERLNIVLRLGVGGIDSRAHFACPSSAVCLISPYHVQSCNRIKKTF